jgi:ribosomal protein L12E/L44/L45/RPP1/RPP2
MSRDTSSEIEERRISALAALAPEARLEEALRMSDAVAAIAAAGRAYRESKPVHREPRRDSA